jgi:hypothetical protein
MQFQHPKDLKPKAARELALELQLRILKLENCLDDLSRSVEIAQFTKQYNVTEAFVRDAEALLEDRLIVPEADQSNAKFTLVEGELSQDTIDQIKSSAKV